VGYVVEPTNLAPRSVVPAFARCHYSIVPCDVFVPGCRSADGGGGRVEMSLPCKNGGEIVQGTNFVYADGRVYYAPNDWNTRLHPPATSQCGKVVWCNLLSIDRTSTQHA